MPPLSGLIKAADEERSELAAQYKRHFCKRVLNARLRRPISWNMLCSRPANKLFSSCHSLFFLVQSNDAHTMKISLPLVFLVVVASAFAADVMKFVSPDKSSTLVVDKSQKRDVIELRSGKRVHRLFYEDLDSIFKPKIAEAFNASLNKVGKVVLPTFTSARWISPDEVEITGESGVIINDDNGDEFTFTASVSKSGSVKNLTVVPMR